jgi:hypothetical protein
MQETLAVFAPGAMHRVSDAAVACLVGAGLVLTAAQGIAQGTQAEHGPIAIVPLENGKSGTGATVTGALEVSGGKAVIVASGTVRSGTKTTDVLLPHRGTLRICASTAVKLASDASVPAGETPGLMMALDSGAVEASFATGKNADIVMTPDFRIVIGGPGAAEVRIRLGEHGDACVENAGVNAPYVLVSSVFEGGAYRVQAGQRVMFQHGSLREVVDQEKEPCGCPPDAVQGNEFPLAQSEGLAPLAGSAPVQSGTTLPAVEPLTYDGAKKPERTQDQPVANQAAMQPTTAARKPGLLARVGRFFRRVFGAE